VGRRAGGGGAPPFFEPGWLGGFFVYLLCFAEGPRAARHVPPAYALEVTHTRVPGGRGRAAPEAAMRC